MQLRILFEELLHPQRRANLHARHGGVRAGITEPMSDPGRHQDRSALDGQDGPEPESKPHPALENGEPFLLNGVSMPGRDVSAPWQDQVEAEESAAGFLGRLPDDYPLSAHRVVDDLSRRDRRSAGSDKRLSHVWLRHAS